MPSGIYKRKPFTKEHKRNMSLCQKGHNRCGWKLSEETKRKMQEYQKTHSNSGRFKKGHKLGIGKILSEEHKKKLSKINTGNIYALGKHHKLSEETKRKMSLNKQGKIAYWNIGKKLPEWHKEKLRIRNTGSNSAVWVNGNYKKRQIRYDSACQGWIKKGRIRDGFKCKINNEDCKGQLEVHHILSWRDYPELRYDINNGITLCHSHHPRKWTEEKRLIPTFQELILQE